MKHLLALLLLPLLLMAGCQKTPDKPIVIQKDLAQMLNTAKNDTPEETAKSLREQYDIPESYQFATQGANGKLTIALDAKVEAPDCTAMPIYRVKLAGFSQKTVSAFFQALCGDAEMWETRFTLTKAELQNEIVYMKKQIAEYGNAEGYEIVLAEWEAELADLEKRMQNAPDTIEDVRADGSLKEKTITTFRGIAAEEGAAANGAVRVQAETETYLALNAYEKAGKQNGGAGKTFVAESGISPFILYFDEGNKAGAINFHNASTQPVLDDADVDAEIASKIGLKPSEAMQRVQALLDQTNSGMVVDSIYLQNDAQAGNFNGVTRPAEQYAYKIYCVRAVNAIPCSAILGSTPAEDDVRPSWLYEELSFVVNGDGIANMCWMCPCKVTDTINENAKLKPFSEIQEIFETMMLIKHDPTAMTYGKLDFKINRVALTLHRIIEQNAPESGLFVPAWNFYGLSVRTSMDGDASFSEFGRSFMTINAIDGSVIDTETGY